MRRDFQSSSNKQIVRPMVLKHQRVGRFTGWQSATAVAGALAMLVVASGTAEALPGVPWRATTKAKGPVLTRAGAAANMAGFRARYPATKPTRTVPARDVAGLKAAAASARPGDVIELTGGTYEGDVEFPAVGTEAARITIRRAAGSSAVVSGASVWSLNGRYTDVRGLRFEGTKSRTIVIRGFANRVIENEFVQAGGGEDGSSTGLIKVENDSGWQGGALGLGFPLQDRRAEVVGNSFAQPANTVYFQEQGVLNSTFSWNTIQGPHRMTSGGESMAVKIGYGFQDEITNTKVMFNTINAWDAVPYVIGIKSSRATVAYNSLERGRITLRSGFENALVGNDLFDGELHLNGRGHLVKGNRVRNATSIDNLGAVTVYILTAKDSEPKVDGQEGRPYFYAGFSDSLIEGNQFLALDSRSGAVVYAVGGERPFLDRLPSGNRWVGNTFVLRNSPFPFIDVSSSTPDLGPNLVKGNRFERNVFTCIASCQNAEESVRGLLAAAANKYTPAASVAQAWDVRAAPIAADRRITAGGSAGAPR